MRVGIDATGWVNRRGYGRFARNAISRLVELDPETTYVLYIDEESAASANLPSAAEARFVRLSVAPTSAASAGSSRPVRDLLRLAAAVRRDRLDAFLFPSLQTYFPVVGAPTIVGLHDAIPEELPQLTMPSRRSRAFWRAKQSLAVRRAARLFTVSEAARQALADRLGIRAERVALVPEAPDPVFSRRSPSEVAGARASVGLGAHEPYLLYAGGISPHKNVETLIDAFARVPRGRLVLVGDLERETYVSAAASVRERIARHELERHVLLPGFVSDDVLAALYTGAVAVVIPSLGEGFGLPAVEAASCGAPLILSDLPAHRETLDGAALYFPPLDRDALVELLEDVARDPAGARALAERGRQAVAGMTWDVAAERLRQLIADAARPSVKEPR
jgi:glycosyltransferase involved in cell wall biosynthesis